MVQKLRINEDYVEPSIPYSQFRTDYSWALKKYPDTYNFYDKYDIDCGTLETINYEKQGNRWVQVESETKPFTGMNYMNIIEGSPFFKNLGGRESIETCRTRFGIIPCKITSISPDRTKKTVRIMSFDKTIAF